MVAAATRDGARAGGEELKKRFPMLQIKIYDAQTNAREESGSPKLKCYRDLARVRRAPHRALVNRAALRLGHPASIPRVKTAELFAGGTREKGPAVI
jgi:hypothetical protein